VVLRPFAAGVKKQRIVPLCGRLCGIGVSGGTRDDAVGLFLILESAMSDSKDGFILGRIKTTAGLGIFFLTLSSPILFREASKIGRTLELLTAGTLHL